MSKFYELLLKSPYDKTSLKVGAGTLVVRYKEKYGKLLHGIEFDESFTIGKTPGFLTLQEAKKIRDWLSSKAIPALEKMSREDFEKTKEKLHSGED